jgi:major membrane immunogen (membrane-anchored lipoprotein)
MKKIWIISAIAAAVMMTGCGGSSSDSISDDTTAIDLPDGKTLIFFDNESSAQYLYNTDTETYQDMNIAGENYDMTGKNGKLIVWNHETVEGVDPKIVMLHDDFNINEGNLTYTGFHYLGHFHEENSVAVFAAHSADEFDPDISSDAQKSTLESLNMHLLEQEEIREEIEEVLPSGETLCNFFVLGHETHEEDEENTTEESAPHIALTTSGKVYIYEETDAGLTPSQGVFTLDGVTECKESESSIIQNSDYGVLIFMAQTQKLYVADSHGEDFHVHSTWDAEKFLPSGFTPTLLTGIGESEHDHEDE